LAVQLDLPLAGKDNPRSTTLHPALLLATSFYFARRRIPMKKVKRTCAIFVLCAATAIASPAQTFTTLVDFEH